MCRQIQKQAKHEIDLEALIDNTQIKKTKQNKKDITQVMTSYLVKILKVIWHVYCVHEN